MNTDLRSLLRFCLGSAAAVAVVWGFIQVWNPPEPMAPKPTDVRAVLSAGLVLGPVAAPALLRMLAP